VARRSGKSLVQVESHRAARLSVVAGDQARGEYPCRAEYAEIQDGTQAGLAVRLLAVQVVVREAAEPCRSDDRSIGRERIGARRHECAGRQHDVGRLGGCVELHLRADLGAHAHVALAVQRHDAA
jgi:hypothetical protein